MRWRVHVVRQGEYLALLAQRFSFDTETVWNDARNEELRALRSDPNMLAPGDLLQIPDEPREGPRCAARTTNRYRGRLLKVAVAVRLLDDAGQPIANEPYVVDGLPEPIEGTTDAEGRVSFEAPLSAGELTLDLVNLGRQHPIRVGHLDPPDTAGGARQRLTHLGFYGAAYGDRPSPPPDEERDRRAVQAFQRAHGLPPNGVLDAATSQRLREVHGA